MNILAFDTSTPVCTVALLSQGETFQRHELAPRQQTAKLLPFIDGLLAEAGVSISDVDLIACGVGPGSFMGVRLAVSVAQGIALGSNLPVLPVSTLQVLAQSSYASHGVGGVHAAWDARMQEIYYGYYKCNGAGIMQPVGQDTLLKPVSLKLAVDQATMLAGNAWDIYAADLQQVDVGAFLQQDSQLYPHAASLITIAQSADSEDYLSPAQLQPVYLRAALQ